MVKQVSFASNKPPRILESRKSRRRQADVAGKVVCEENASALKCTILDISDSGASIRVSERQAIPSRLFLVNMQTRIVYESEVVWVAYAQRGLRFLHTYLNGDRLPPLIEARKRQWFAPG